MVWSATSESRSTAAARVFSSASSRVFPWQTYIMKSNDCPNFSVMRV